MTTASATACLFSGNYCIPHESRKADGEEHICRKAAALEKGAGKECVCKKTFLSAQGSMLNPRLERAIKLQLVDPKAFSFGNSQARKLFATLSKEPTTEICPTCVTLLPGAVTNDDIGSIPYLVTKTELARVRDELKAGPAGVARKIARGEAAIIGGTRGEGSLRQTECAVHANEPLACACGGYGDWALMRAIVVPGRGGAKPKVFGFGPPCAAAIEQQTNIIFAKGTLGQELYNAGFIDFVPKPRENLIPQKGNGELDLSRQATRGKRSKDEKKIAKRNAQRQQHEEKVKYAKTHSGQQANNYKKKTNRKTS